MPPILLDLSRLLSRARSPTPTGIDRIELAYAEHLAARAGEQLRYVTMSIAGEIAPLRKHHGQLLVETLSRCWRDPDGSGRAARRIATLARLAASAASGQTWRRNGQRPVYLNVSHQNLQHRERFARFKARSGAAFVFFVHDLIPIDYPEFSRPGQHERHRRRIETICAFADGVVVNSGATAVSLAPSLARAGRNIPVLVAYPGGAFAAPTPDRPVSDRPYFVCVGTMEPRKNHLMLLLLWRQLALREGQAAPRLVLVGARGWKSEAVADLLERSDALRGLVEEHSAMPDRTLRALLSGACALLCPSFVEGYGLPVAEALALRVPVICSDIPAFREIGRDAPEFLDPLDGPAWLRAIRDYTAPQSLQRHAQIVRLEHWRPVRWEEHIDRVAALLDQVSSMAMLPYPVPRGTLATAAQHGMTQLC